MIDGIPNQPFYFHQKDTIGYSYSSMDLDVVTWFITMKFTPVILVQPRENYRNGATFHACCKRILCSLSTWIYMEYPYLRVPLTTTSWCF